MLLEQTKGTRVRAQALHAKYTDITQSNRTTQLAFVRNTSCFFVVEKNTKDRARSIYPQRSKIQPKLQLLCKLWETCCKWTSWGPSQRTYSTTRGFATGFAPGFAIINLRSFKRAPALVRICPARISSANSLATSACRTQDLDVTPDM